MQEMQVLAIGLDTQRGTPLLLVAEQGGRQRALPLSIGVAEAVAIQLALRGIQPPRPPTHRLIVDVYTALGTRLDHRVLRHRAGRISDAERAEWAEVWSSSSRYSAASSSASAESEKRSAT